MSHLLVRNSLRNTAVFVGVVISIATLVLFLA